MIKKNFNREDIGQSVASVAETLSDSGTDDDFPIRASKDGEHIVIDDHEAEERIKRARDARKEFFEQEKQEQIEERVTERDTDSNTSFSTVEENNQIQSSQQRKFSTSSESTDSEAEKSKKSLDESVKQKYKKDWEVEEMKSSKPQKKNPLFSESSKQSAIENLESQFSIESLKIEAEKIKSSFTKTIEEDARSLEGQISERLTGNYTCCSIMFFFYFPFIASSAFL